jgi:N-acetylglucosaminyl-diphospho-decaprenol L-rhamnosyltransferase
MGEPAEPAELAGPPLSGSPVAAVVVNYNAGSSLTDCVRSLLEAGVERVVVVDNGSADGSVARLQASGLPAEVVRPGRNLGYGGAANLGVSATTEPFVLICNPDLTVDPAAVGILYERLRGDEALSVAGPMLRETDGTVYPSGRSFPALADAIGHAFVGLVWGGNPWTKRYRHLGADQHEARSADWVSGACFLVRRLAYESVRGFDDAYFMYAEDVDLCWRLRRAGWGVQYEPAAEVVHEQGRSTSRHPYRMLVEHHRSLWRFARRSATGSERLLLPVMGVGLAARLVLAWAEHLFRPVRERVAPTAKVRNRARGEHQS